MQTQTVPLPPRVPQYDHDSLAEFLSRISPRVLKVLDDLHGSTAFDGYDLGSNGEPAVNVQLINRLNSLEMSDFKVILIFL